VNLPDPESFFETVRKRSWPGKAKRPATCGDCEFGNGGKKCMFDYDPSNCPLKEGRE